MESSVDNNLEGHTILNDLRRQDMHPNPNGPNFGISPGSEASDDPSKDLTSKWNEITQYYAEIQKNYDSLIQQKKNFDEQYNVSHGDRSDPNNGRALTTKGNPNMKPPTIAREGSQHTARNMIYGTPKFNDILDNVEKEETYKKFNDSQSKYRPSPQSENGDTSKTGVRTVKVKHTHVQDSVESRS
jgi:hypothetical protein